MRGAVRVVSALALAAAVAVPSMALARGGDAVRKAGVCTSGVTSTLKVSPADRGLEVEFEVDQNRSGVPWRVTLHHNGRRVFAGSRVTRAPSGSFTVRRVVAAAAGSDRLVARATRPTGASCRAVVVVP